MAVVFELSTSKVVGFLASKDQTYVKTKDWPSPHPDAGEEMVAPWKVKVSLF